MRWCVISPSALSHDLKSINVSKLYGIRIFNELLIYVVEGMAIRRPPQSPKIPKEMVDESEDNVQRHV